MGLFDSLLHRHERERQAGILADLARLGRERWRREADANDGFLPPRRAAREMGLEPEQLVELVQTGMLEARSIRGEVYVRPALVSVMKVSTT